MWAAVGSGPTDIIPDSYFIPFAPLIFLMLNSDRALARPEHKAVFERISFLLAISAAIFCLLDPYCGNFAVYYID